MYPLTWKLIILQQPISNLNAWMAHALLTVFEFPQPKRRKRLLLVTLMSLFSIDLEVGSLKNGSLHVNMGILLVLTCSTPLHHLSFQLTSLTFSLVPWWIPWETTLPRFSTLICAFRFLFFTYENYLGQNHITKIWLCLFICIETIIKDNKYIVFCHHGNEWSKKCEMLIN